MKKPALPLIGFLSVLLAAAGPAITVGEGVFLLLAVVIHVWKPTSFSALCCAAAASLAVGTAAASSWMWFLPSVTAVVMHVLASRAEPIMRGPWMPSWQLPLIAGVLGALLTVMPNFLPKPEIARARPLPEALEGALITLGTAAVMALLCRFPTTRPLRIGMTLAGAVPVLLAARLFSLPFDASVQELLHAADEAGRLGLARHQARRVEEAMLTSEKSGDLHALKTIYEKHTNPENLTRRQPQILRLAARGLEASAGPPSDVDALLRRALSFSTPADVESFQQWPGKARSMEVAQRARSPLLNLIDPSAAPAASHANTLDCFGGVWCVVKVELPVPRFSPTPVDAKVWIRKVAPAVSDVVIFLRLTWDGWNAETKVAKDVVHVGEEVELTIPVDMTQPPPGHHEIWMQVRPTHGAPLTLAQRKGTWLYVGKMVVEDR